MKKIIAFAFTAIVILALAACNNNKTGNDNRGPSETDSANVAPSDTTGRQY